MGNISILTDVYGASSDVIAVVLSGLLLAIFNQVSTKSSKSYKYFSVMYICIGLAACLNLTFSTLTKLVDESKYFVLFILKDSYHALLMISLVYLLGYAITMMSLPDKRWVFYMCLGGLICINTIILDCLSPVTHFGLWYDSANKIWYTGGLLSPYVMGYVLFYAFYAYLLIAESDYIFYKVKRVLVCAGGVTLFMTLYQGWHNNSSTTAMTFLLPTIVIMFMLHTSSYNANTGALNQESLEDYIRIAKGTHKLYIFTFDNYEKVSADKSRMYFCNFWKKRINDGKSYFINDNIFVLITKPKNVAHVNDVEFLDYSLNGFKKIGFDVRSVALDCDFPMTYNNFSFVLDFALSKIEKQEVYIFTEDDTAERIKNEYILSELRDISTKFDLNDERVAVYCQPVKNVCTGQFDTAEALMRLKLDEYGMIEPGVFIPLAEKYQIIHNLSLIILNKVCSVIRKLNDENFEINRISVNFAIQEFRNQHFTDDIIRIIKANDIDYNQIAMEVTESEKDEDFDLLQDAIDKFKRLQIHLYLDDFGTGYSNFDRIFKLRLNVVKFDRSFLNMISYDGKPMTFLLKHFAEVFNELGFEVLFEGVETEEQEQLCINAKADYLQGYRYSKPIPIDNLKQFLNHR